MNKVNKVKLTEYLSKYCKGCVTKKIQPKESKKISTKKGVITNG